MAAVDPPEEPAVEEQPDILFIPRGIPRTQAQDDYDGPAFIRDFADFLPYIGEFIVAFGRLERNVTWAIQSLTGATREEGNELDSTVQQFANRFAFLDLIARNRCNTQDLLNTRGAIVGSIRTLNSFRNSILHNSAVGRQMTVDRNGVQEVKMMIRSIDRNSGREGTIFLSTSEMRAKTELVFETIDRLRAWIFILNPHAENVVP